jgi:hypothetical protein
MCPGRAAAVVDRIWAGWPTCAPTRLTGRGVAATLGLVLLS